MVGRQVVRLLLPQAPPPQRRRWSRARPPAELARSAVLHVSESAVLHVSESAVLASSGALALGVTALIRAVRSSRQVGHAVEVGVGGG